MARGILVSRAFFGGSDSNWSIWLIGLECIEQVSALDVSNPSRSAC